MIQWINIDMVSFLLLFPIIFVHALMVLALEESLQNIQCWVNNILVTIKYQTWPSVFLIFAHET